MITKFQLSPGNEMLRLGFGRHYGVWFIRADLWRVAYRWSEGKK